MQKNEVITPLEPSIFTRDIQNNIRVSDTDQQMHHPTWNFYLRLTKSYDSLLQTMALCQKEIFDLMRSNAQLVESIQNQSLGKDDSNSIDHSRLWILNSNHTLTIRKEKLHVNVDFFLFIIAFSLRSREYPSIDFMIVFDSVNDRVFYTLNL